MASALQTSVHAMQLGQVRPATRPLAPVVAAAVAMDRAWTECVHAHSAGRVRLVLSHACTAHMGAPVMVSGAFMDCAHAHMAMRVAIAACIRRPAEDAPTTASAELTRACAMKASEASSATWRSAAAAPVMVSVPHQGGAFAQEAGKGSDAQSKRAPAVFGSRARGNRARVMGCAL